MSLLQINDSQGLKQISEISVIIEHNIQDRI